MSKTTWSYQELTAAVESRIKCLMQIHQSKTGSEERAATLAFASGIYHFWRIETYLAQTQKDLDRIENLVYPRHEVVHD